MHAGVLPAVYAVRGGGRVDRTGDREEGGGRDRGMAVRAGMGCGADRKADRDGAGDRVRRETHEIH